MTSVKSERYYVKTLFRVLFPYASSFCSSYMELFYAVECDGTGFVQKFDTTETKLILHVLTSLQQQQKQNMKVRRNISCYNFFRCKRVTMLLIGIMFWKFLSFYMFCSSGGGMSCNQIRKGDQIPFRLWHHSNSYLVC